MAAEPRILRDSTWARVLKAELAASEDPCRVWIAARGNLVKQDVNSVAALIDLADDCCFAKWYGPKSGLHRRVLSSSFGRPLRNQDSSRELYQAGVAVAQPRGCLWCGDGALVLAEALEGGKNLHARWLSAERPVDRRLLIKAVAKSLAQLHLAAFSHGDCKWSNLLYLDEQVYLVDLDAARRGRLGGRRQARDLARFTLDAEELAVDQETYEVFLANYFTETGVSRDAMTALMLPILHRLRRRHQRQYGDRGRPLW